MESHSSGAAESKSSKANQARNGLIMKAKKKACLLFTSESSVQQRSLKILLASQKLSGSNLLFLSKILLLVL
jgi:hypothetical protein